MIKKPSNNLIIKLSAYILGIIAFILSSLSLIKTVSTTQSSDLLSSTSYIGLYKLTVDASDSLNPKTSIGLSVLGIMSIVFVSLFLLSYGLYMFNSFKNKQKFNLYPCLFVVAVIITLAIGLINKPYADSKENGDISPFLTIPDDIALLDGLKSKFTYAYTSVGIACVTIVSILGVCSTGVIVIDLFKNLIKPSKKYSK